MNNHGIVFIVFSFLAPMLFAGTNGSIGPRQSDSEKLWASLEKGGDEGSAEIQQLLFEKIYAGLSSEELYELMNQKKEDGTTLFDYAFEKSDLPLLATLMSFLADPRESKQKNIPPVHLLAGDLAYLCPSRDIGDMLYGFNKSFGSPSYHSALVLNFLLNAKKYPDTTKYPHLARFSFKNFDVLDKTIIDVLSWHNISQDDTKYKDGLTLLHGHARNGDISSIASLLAKGHSIASNDHATPLEVAWAFGKNKTINFLATHSPTPRLSLVLKYFDGREKTAQRILQGISHQVFSISKTDINFFINYLENGKLHGSLLESLFKMKIIPLTDFYIHLLNNPHVEIRHLAMIKKVKNIERIIGYELIQEIVQKNHQPATILNYIVKNSLLFGYPDETVLQQMLDIKILYSLALNPQANENDFRELIQLGIDLSSKEEVKLSPLQLITMRPWCSLPVIKILVNAGVSMGDPNARFYAVANVVHNEHGCKEWLQFLLQHGGIITKDVMAQFRFKRSLIKSEQSRIEGMKNLAQSPIPEFVSP